ncbi:MAG: STAS domain-containing protein, partial [Gammaproteobacteria bacterium]
VRLDLAAVSYISSAGLRVLLAHWKELRRTKGSLAVTAVSAEVERIFKLAGLGMLLEGKVTATGTTDSPFTSGATTARVRPWKGPGFTGEIEELSANARWRGKLILPSAPNPSSPSQSFKLPLPTLALGLGAFGNSSPDSALRLGEFLAVNGNAVCLPTDGTNRPDYAVSEGEMAPEAWVAEGLVADGAFARMARFEAVGDTGGVKLSDLISNLLNVSGDSPYAFAAVVESVALVGAYRRRPPSVTTRDNNFAFPAVREWLTFTAEPSYQNTIALLVGVVARENSAMSAFTRPYGVKSGPRAHIHAAVFPYRPVRYGLSDLGQTLGGLFESKRIITVMHLLSDPRPEVGAGESRFYRGACWFAPIDIS